MRNIAGNVKRKVGVPQQFLNGNGAVTQFPPPSVSSQATTGFFWPLSRKMSLSGSPPKRIKTKKQVLLTMKRRLWHWELNSETETISYMVLEASPVCRKLWESRLKYLAHREVHLKNEKLSISIWRILSIEIDVNLISNLKN